MINLLITLYFGGTTARSFRNPMSPFEPFLKDSCSFAHYFDEKEEIVNAVKGFLSESAPGGLDMSL